LFTEYGKLAMKNNADNKQKPFQKLQFLVRDFGFIGQYGEGAAAGEKFLKDRLEIKDHHPKESKNLRNQINSCFDVISCFVMPNPGKAVCKNVFKGKLKGNYNNAFDIIIISKIFSNSIELDEDFKDSLKEFIPLVVGPGTLKPKRINGQYIKSKDLIFYAAEFAGMFQNKKIPTALTLFEVNFLLAQFLLFTVIYFIVFKATIKANHMSAIEESKDAYNNYMKPLCDDIKEYIPMNELLLNHEKAVKKSNELVII